MDIVGPSQNFVRVIYRRSGSAEHVVNRCTFLFGRWEHEEREVGGRVGLEHGRRRYQVVQVELKMKVSLEVKRTGSLERTWLNI